MMHLTLCPTGDTLIAGPNTTRQRNKLQNEYFDRALPIRKEMLLYGIVSYGELS